MCGRITRMTFLAVATIAALAEPVAVAETPRCAALASSPLAEPEWYVEECLGGVPPAFAPAAPGPWLQPGDTQYIMNIRGAGTFPDSLVTAPVPTLTYTLVGAQPPSRDFYAVDFDLAAQVLWGIDSACNPLPCVGRTYGTFNLTTGAFTPVGTIAGPPTDVNFSSMKFDPTTGVVYMTTAVGMPTVNQLWTLNLASGVATLVGTIVISPTPPTAAIVVDIAISNSGQIYGHDIANDIMIAIDKTTAAATVLGSTTQNANFAQGMDFDLSTNVLYAYMYIGNGVNNLSTVNLTTGAATIIVPAPAGPENEGAIKVATIAPEALTVDAASNGVLQPNETVVVAPSWRNNLGVAMANVTGVLSNFIGPVGATYTINDSAASYGTIPAATTQSCGSNCYGVTVTAASRPVTHWDSSALETLSPGGITKTWTLHVGNSFADVPPANPFFRFIETILHKNVTGGCAADTYCPTNPTTREQMAVFVLRSREPAGYTPPACVPAEPVHGRPGDQPLLPLDRRAGQPRRGHRLRRRICTARPARPRVSRWRSSSCARWTRRSTRRRACRRTCSRTFRRPAPSAAGSRSWPTAAWSPAAAAATTVPPRPVTREQMSVFLAVTFGILLYGCNGR